jgi:hypothetical protein
MTDDLVDYDPQDYPEAVTWAKERAKELRRQSERIAELEAELQVAKRLNAKWMDEKTEAIIRAERAEKDVRSLRNRLDAYLRGHYGQRPEGHS